MSMTPREIVSELDRHIIGQNDAKRAVAIALRNLVENAVRHAPQGPIVLEVSLPATCSVRDQGPGMAPQRALELQQRHQRGGGQQHVPGYGLGLSIVATIVQRQGGQLALLSPAPGQSQGLQAVLELRRILRQHLVELGLYKP